MPTQKEMLLGVLADPTASESKKELAALMLKFFAQTVSDTGPEFGVTVAETMVYLRWDNLCRGDKTIVETDGRVEILDQVNPDAPGYKPSEIISVKPVAPVSFSPTTISPRDDFDFIDEI